MRNISTILALMLLPLFIGKVSAQTPADTTIYEVVEKMPEYPGGIKQCVKDWRAFAQKFIDRHFPYDNPYFGGYILSNRYSMISFIIHENGQVTDAVITKSLDEHNDRAALLFVKSMPRWIPGELNGKKVKVKMTLPFTLFIH